MTEQVQVTPGYLRACSEIRKKLPRVRDFSLPLTQTQLALTQGPTCPDPTLAALAPGFFSDVANSWHRHQRDSLWSVASSPDGDCLFNSLQLALFGTEAGADVLRLLVHLEDVSEVHRYSFDACREDNKCTLFGSYGLTPDEIKHLTDSSAQVGTPQNLNIVAACSAVIKRPIAVLYPKNGTRSSHGRYSTLIKPMHMEMLAGPVIDIAWTSCVTQEAENFLPNHFIPLLPHFSHEHSKLPLPAPFFNMTESESQAFYAAIQSSKLGASSLPQVIAISFTTRSPKSLAVPT